MRERKFKKSRAARRVYLVICEGETEKNYVELLKRHYRLPVIIKTRISGNYVNARLVRQYVRELSEYGVDNENDCSIFYVYDGDVTPVVEKLQALPGTPIITTPCIEFWFMLHARDYKRALSSEASVRELAASHAVWSNYQKGRLDSGQTAFLMANQANAVTRAQKLKWPDNPSSNFYKMIEALDAERH